MTDVTHLRISWVNGGQPFPVAHDLLTAEDQRQGLLAKIRTLKEQSGGIPADAPEALRNAIHVQVRQAAAVAHFTAMLFNIVRRIDPRLKSKTDEELESVLTTGDFDAFMTAVSPADVEPAAKGEGVDAAPIPLAQPAN